LDCSERFIFLIFIGLTAFLPSVACCFAGRYSNEKYCPPWWTETREGCYMRNRRRIFYEKCSERPAWGNVSAERSDHLMV